MDKLKLGRVLELVKEKNPKTVLIHQNNRTNLKKVLERELESDITLTTTDLKYTRGINQEIKTENDLVIYLADSHEPVELTKSIVNEYISNSPVLIIGRKNTGIKRITEPLEVEESFYSKGFQVVLLPKQESVEVDLTEETIETVLNEVELRFRTVKGLFSYKQIDEGTRFLLDNIEIGSKGKVLDFGCGYGVIGIYVAKKHPESKVVMVDSDLRALKYCRSNCRLNKVANTEVKSSYLMENIKGKFDVILSNPPTHTKSSEVEKLFEGFHNHLKKNGEAYIVINKNLEYEDTAGYFFEDVEVVKEGDRYKLIKLVNRSPG